MPTEQELSNAIRFLSIDAVEQANSGHPGMPMGMADIATVLWREFLQHSPNNPNWFDRDRFILSNGHGSMLQYALLHLTGYDLPMEQIKRFRQLHSRTPGHPENQDTPGVETTTGPLGQGLANGVGMALAEAMLAAEFNRPEHTIVDHHTYVFAGDGCLMEGVSHEACSLAGTLGLGKLIVFYDDNGISIDGDVRGWFTDDTPQRFSSYNWHVIDSVDGHDSQAIRQAIAAAKAQTDRPTLICCQTHIGFGSPNTVDTAGAHGAPLGKDEIALARQQLNWPHDPFVIPDAISNDWNQQEAGVEFEQAWNAAFAQYESAYPELASEFLRRMQGYLPEDFQQRSQAFITQLQAEQQPAATRKASLVCINHFAKELPELMGGSADLSGSNCTQPKGVDVLSKDHYAGRYLHYGVREFGMAALMNGLALHGGWIPFGGTFLVFADYARNALRLSALMQQKTIHVFTHDSIGLGEDGPTHQPIEHAAMLRLTPNYCVWRPADSVETAVAWQQALLYQGPSGLLLSRQTLPAYERTMAQLENVAKGGYVLKEAASGDCDAIILATGSEVDLAMQAHGVLEQQGIQVRVVSMPCVEQFLQQDQVYQQSVLPDKITARVVVEAGATAGWYRFVSPSGAVLGIDRFGFSAPYQEVYQACGLTVEAVVASVKSCLHTTVVQ